MFALTAIILGLTTIGNCALLILVARDAASLAQRVFALYIGTITAWGACILFNLWLESLLVEHLIFFFAALFLTAQFWFAKLFPDEKMPKAPLEYWSLSVGVAFASASLWPGSVFSSLSIHREGYTELGNGFLSAQYSLFALVYVLAPIFILTRKYRKSQDERLRKQLLMLIWGFVVFAVVNLGTNSALPVFFGIYFFNAIGPVFSLLLAAFIAYSIYQHRLFNIRATIQRGAFYTLLFGAVVTAYIGALSLLQYAFALTLPVAVPISAGAVMILGMYLMPGLEKLFRHYTDRFFFKDAYDYPSALEELSVILENSLNLKDLIPKAESSLGAFLRAKRVQIQLSNQEEIEYVLKEPIVLNGKVIGLIGIEEKLSGDPYSKEDRQLVKTFSHQAATALGRALLFKEVQEHAVELEQKVAERTAELSAAQDNQRQMMLDIAHGLQVPLTVFRLKVEERLNTQDNKEDSVLERSVMDLSNFISSLMRLAKLDYGQTTSDFQSISLSKLVEELVEEVEVIAEAKDIRVQSSITPNLHIRADQNEIRSAIMNLASNSIKYMGAKTLREIRFELKITDQEKASLTIKDTGIGIAPDALPHIFDRFYRTKQLFTSVGGGGLGLAIVKQIVSIHQGQIEARSTLGQGTTIEIRLPLETNVY